MSDLISRKSLKDSASEYTLSQDEYKRFCEIIDSVPTAYDIDKVVEELGSNSFITVNQEEIETKRKDIQSYISVEKEVVLIKDAIEIVKQGGIGKEVN